MHITFPLVAVRRLAFRLKVSFQVVLSFAVLALWLAGGSVAEAQTVNFSGVSVSAGSGFSAFGVAVDAAGDVFVADYGNSVVKEIVAVNGAVSPSSQVIVVGSGFSTPTGVAVDAAGDVFVADYGNSAVKEIVAVNGVVSSSSQVIVVGSGFSTPTGVAVDAAGDVFVADEGHNEAKEIVAVNGAVSTSSQVNIVGSGFSGPTGVAVDAAGDVFVADAADNAVKEIVAVHGAVSTSSQVNIVGSGFSGPGGVAVDAAGDVFVADQGNSVVKEIVAVNGAVSSSSQVKIVGSGFGLPSGVAVDARGDVFVADLTTTTVTEIELEAVNLGSVAVGSSSTLTFNFTFTAGGTIAAPGVFTQGATGLDFTDAGTGTCTTNGTTHTYSAGDTCTVAVSFRPLHPGIRLGAVQLVSTGGTLLASAYVSGTGTGPMVTYPSNVGINGAAAVGTGGGLSSVGSRIASPISVALDGRGDVFAVNVGRNNVQEIVAVNGKVSSSSTVNTLNFTNVSHPAGLAFDGSGNLFIANDTTVQEVIAVNGQISAGSAVQTVASGFTGAYAVAVDGNGDVFVADYLGNAVKEIVAVNGAVSSGSPVIPVGSGFQSPFGVAVDGSGNVFVADYRLTAIREIVAVNGTVSSSSAVISVGSGFSFPFGVAVDAAGNVYVADHSNKAVKEIVSANGSVSASSTVLTLGSGFGAPYGVAVDGNGNLYVADSGSGVTVVKELDVSDAPSLSFSSTVDGSTSTDSPQTVTVANIGNQPLSFEPPISGSNPSIATGFTLTTGGTTCPVLSSSSSAQTLAAGASCTLGIEFTPVAPDSGTVSGSVVITDNNLMPAPTSSTTQSITLSGTAALPGDTTATTLVSSSSSIGSGQTTVLSVTVADETNPGTTPSGTVAFTDTLNGVTTQLFGGNTVPLHNGSVSEPAQLTGDGVHTVTATYAGVSGSFLGSSNTTTVTVGAATHFGVAAATPEYEGASFTVTVTALDANNQNATLYAGTVKLTSSDQTAALPSNATLTDGVGTFTLTLNAPGSQTIAATDTVTNSIAGSASVNVLAPPTFTVTVATDTTSGVAANCTANSTTDANCSLRDAIAAVTALNLPTVTPTIQFSPQLTSGGPVTITEGSAGTLTLAANMNIVGPGQTLLAIDGANLYEVMAVNSGVTASISGVTVQHGNVQTTGSGVFAGGIANQGTLTVTDSTVSSNSAGQNAGGGISSLGTLAVVRCKITNNSAGNGGGGIYSYDSTLTISGSSITGNTNNGDLQNHGGGGVIGQLSTVSISNSTISGNNSSAVGGGLELLQGSATLTNVTVSGNAANTGTANPNGDGGGIFNYGGRLTLIQSTVSGNIAAASSSGTGGGIYNFRAVSTSLKNSVVAGNTASTSYPNIQGTVIDNGGNIYDTTATSTLNPQLAVLGSYGGATQAQPGLPGSPVLCAGLVSNVGALTTDQRGNPRIATYGANQCVDAGAVQTAYSLSFSQQPSNTQTTAAISPAPAVLLKDNGVANGIPGASISMALAAGTLNGTATATTDSTGTASFLGLSVATAEAGETLTASAAVGANTVTATSSTFNIVSADHLTVTVPSTAVAGTPFTATVTAYLDRAGTQVATRYTGPVTLTSSDLAAVVPGPTNLTAGVATVQVTLKTAGSQTMTAADASGTPSGTSPAVLVTAAPINSLVAVSGGGQTVAEGTAFANPLVVEALDAYGNPVGGQVVTFAAPATGVSATLSSATVTTAGTGLAQVTATANGTPGNYNVTATTGGFSQSFPLTNTGPATYTVTVASDTTTGVASNCTVNATTDANCSLRDAIAAATALNVPSITPNIQFARALTAAGPVTITEGSAGTLTLGANMNIVGPGQTLLAVDGANLYEVMAVNSGVTAAISGVTVQHGNAPNTGSGVSAGGIVNQGTLTVTDSTITHNFGQQLASAILDNGAALTLTGCTVSYNSSVGPLTTGGGAIVVAPSSPGTFTMSGSSVIGNTGNGSNFSTGGGGINFNQFATASISNSTISGNTMTGGGFGAGLDIYKGSATLTNVTVSGNTSSNYGGGILNYEGRLTLIQSTVSGNSASIGGGIYDYRSVATVLTNSVVAGNSATNTGSNIGSSTNTIAPTDNGGNYFDTGNGSTLNPQLAVLGSYGGSTQTQPGLPGSPVLCAGLLSNVGALTTDQRGNPRVATYGANQCVDAGAVQTAYSLNFSTQPSNTETTVAITPAPAVVLEDNGVAKGIPGASIAVALANGTLNGTATATTDATGTATFSGLSIPQVETGDTLTASAAAGANTVTATSNPFNVTTVTATTAVASKVLTQNQPSVTFTPVTSSGGTAPLTYSITPALPAGLSLASTTGAISGSPTVASAATTYTVTVTDADSVTGTATFSLTVNAAVAATSAIPAEVLTQNHASAPFTPVTATGGTGALTYSVTPALPSGLSFSSSTGAVSGAATVSSAATTYTVTATDTNNDSSSASFTLTVNAAVTATQAVASTTLIVNQAATAFTPVTGAGGTGTLSYSVAPALPAGLSLSSATGAVSGTPTAASSATTYTVTVTDQNGATATATFSLTVILSVPPTVSSVGAVTTTYGSTAGVTVTATESGNEGAATGGVVTFTVSGSATGSFSPATCTLSAAGTCSVTFVPTGTLAAGTYAGGIMASFARVNSYSAATGSSTLTVNQAAQTITFAPVSPVTYGVGTIALTATGGGSGNAITYTLGAGSPATLSGSSLTISGAGTVTVTANQAGNGNYTAASPVTATIVVNQAGPAVSLAASASQILVQNALTLTATVSSTAGAPANGDTVTFYDNTAGAALGQGTLTAGVATFTTSSLTVGTHSITAIFKGDANFSTASSTAVSVLVEDFSLNIAASGTTSATIVPGATATYVFAVSPDGAPTFPANVAFSVSGLPTGATYTLTPSTIASGAGATNVTLTVTAPSTSAKVQGGGPLGRGLAPVAFGLLLLPFSRSVRKRAGKLGRVALAALVLAAAIGAAGGLTGCGYSTGFFDQAQHTYTVTVTGTSGALTHSTTVTLTVE